jgi:hypothetical protein
MQTLRGKVSGIRHTIDVSGGRDAVTTTHLAIFELDGKPVKLGGEATAIDDGDDVEVAGYYRGGLFRASAFRNHTKRTAGSMPCLGYFIFGTLGALVGLMSMARFPDLDGAFAGSMFIVVGLSFVLIGVRIWRAKRLLVS